MVCGTPFQLTSFHKAWTALGRRARRWAKPEDIAECESPHAVTLVSRDGMLVFRLQRDEDAKITAFVVMGVSTTGTPDAFRRNEQHMLAIARDMGATTLAFRAARRGWVRLVGPEWVRSGDQFQRSV